MMGGGSAGNPGVIAQSLRGLTQQVFQPRTFGLEDPPDPPVRPLTMSAGLGRTWSAADLRRLANQIKGQ